MGVMLAPSRHYVQSHVASFLCSPWNAFCSCTVPGALVFVIFWTPTLCVTPSLGRVLNVVLGLCWCCAARCWGSRILTALCLPCHGFCSCSVLRTLGFVVFWILTLAWALALLLKGLPCRGSLSASKRQVELEFELFLTSVEEKKS